MTYDLALVDLDGTITDSAPGIVASVRYAFGELGVPVPDDDALRAWVGPPIEQSVLSNGIPRERLQEFVAAYRVAFRGGGMLDNSVYPGMADALADLRAGGVRLALATSKPEVFARQILEHFGLDHHFEAICGATLDGTRSTKADVVQHALDTVAAGAGLPDDPARTVMVGDREHDVLGARAHGIGTVVVTWGYASPGEIDEARPLAVVDSPGELVARVLAGPQEQVDLGA